MKEHCKKAAFLILAAAFFIVPWLVPAFAGKQYLWVRNYAPGAAVITGIIFAVSVGNPFAKQTGKLSSYLLGAAIVLMGFGMNLVKVLSAGAQGFIYTFVGITLGLGLGYLFGKLFKVEKNCSWLVSVGTSICGGSAIAAAAPALKAKADDIALASATVFTLNAVALMVFPYIGHALNFTETQFGYFAALAIHDTSSVVGASLQFGSTALEVGTTVKLARALWIVPVTLFIATFVAPREAGKKGDFKLKVPWFIPGFLIAAAVMSYLPGVFGDGSQAAAALKASGAFLKEISKYLMIFTLFMIGANLSRQKLRTLGIRPLLHGVVLWLILSVIWCLAIYFKLVNAG
jgi:uncharacterized integral membrane protein (TIGR00698 family)